MEEITEREISDFLAEVAESGTDIATFVKNEILDPGFAFFAQDSGTCSETLCKPL